MPVEGVGMLPLIIQKKCDLRKSVCTETFGCACLLKHWFYKKKLKYDTFVVSE